MLKINAEFLKCFWYEGKNNLTGERNIMISFETRPNQTLHKEEALLNIKFLRIK